MVPAPIHRAAEVGQLMVLQQKQKWAVIVSRLTAKEVPAADVAVLVCYQH